MAVSIGYMVLPYLLNTPGADLPLPSLPSFQPRTEHKDTIIISPRRVRLWTFLISFSTLDPVLETIYLFTSLPAMRNPKLKEAAKLSCKKRDAGKIYVFCATRLEQGCATVTDKTGKCSRQRRRELNDL